jgi:hypothetical protein
LGGSGDRADAGGLILFLDFLADVVVSAATGGVSIVFSMLEFEFELVGVGVALAFVLVLDALVAANCAALVAADANCEEDILRVFLGGISVSSFLLLLLLLLMFLLVSRLLSLLPALLLTGIRIEFDGAAAAL